MYTLYKFHFLNGISKINQLFDDILIIWPAPVYVYFFILFFYQICIAIMYVQYAGVLLTGHAVQTYDKAYETLQRDMFSSTTIPYNHEIQDFFI